jgi:hypothetical protein
LALPNAPRGNRLVLFKEKTKKPGIYLDIFSVLQYDEIILMGLFKTRWGLEKDLEKPSKAGFSPKSKVAFSEFDMLKYALIIGAFSG